MIKTPTSFFIDIYQKIKLYYIENMFQKGLELIENKNYFIENETK